jgi:hypothetical protein
MPKDIEISLTTFVDFLLTAGTTKITRVRDAREQYSPTYDPRKDFWRKLRQGIISMHQRAATPSTLSKVLDGLQDPRKLRLYPTCIAGYQRWMAKRMFTWTGTSNAFWQYQGLTVNVNPELGIRIKEQEHRVKLYFKEEPLTKSRVQTMLHLLRLVAPANIPIMGILDVPRGRFYPLDEPAAGIDALLKGEAQSFTSLWYALGD